MVIVVNRSTATVEAVATNVPHPLVTRLGMALPGSTSRPFKPPPFPVAYNRDPNPRVFWFIRDVATGRVIQKGDRDVFSQWVCVDADKASDTTAYQHTPPI